MVWNAVLFIFAATRPNTDWLGVKLLKKEVALMILGKSVNFREL